MKNRRGILSGYTDLQFSALLIILLVVFAFSLYQKEEATVEDTLQDNLDWEAQWLANTLANYPVDGDPLAFSLANNQTQEERAIAAFNNAIDDTRLYRSTESFSKYATAYFLIRGDKVLVCEADGISLPDVAAKAWDGFCPRAPQNLIEIETPGTYLSQLRKSAEEDDYGFGWSITPGEQQVIIGVKVA